MNWPKKLWDFVVHLNYQSSRVTVWNLSWEMQRHNLMNYTCWQPRWHFSWAEYVLVVQQFWAVHSSEALLAKMLVCWLAGAGQAERFRVESCSSTRWSAVNAGLDAQRRCFPCRTVVASWTVQQARGVRHSGSNTRRSQQDQSVRAISAW